MSTQYFGKFSFQPNSVHPVALTPLKLKILMEVQLF